MYTCCESATSSINININALVAATAFCHADHMGFVRSRGFTKASVMWKLSVPSCHLWLLLAFHRVNWKLSTSTCRWLQCLGRQQHFPSQLACTCMCKILMGVVRWHESHFTVFVLAHIYHYIVPPWEVICSTGSVCIAHGAPGDNTNGHTVHGSEQYCAIYRPYRWLHK